MKPIRWGISRPHSVSHAVNFAEDIEWECERQMDPVKSEEAANGFKCTSCEAKFGRREHLERHVGSIRTFDS